MPVTRHGFLSGPEEQLLHVSLPLAADHGAKGHGHPAALCVGSGDCLEGLERALAPLLPPDSAQAESAVDWFERVSEIATSSQTNQLNALIAGAASLCQFMLANTTGPPEPGVPACPADLFREGSDDTAGETRIGNDDGEDESGDRYAIAQLSEDGEEVEGVVSHPQYLLLALILLRGPKAEESVSSHHTSDATLSSWPWWTARAVLCQQQLLSGRSVTLRRQLDRLWLETLDASASSVPAPSKSLICCLHLERCATALVYGDIDAAAGALSAAETALEFSVSLSGALGKRTVHQHEEKAQLVVRIDHRSATSATTEALSLSSFFAPPDTLLPERLVEGGEQATADVLPVPVLSDAAQAAPLDLSALEQAAVLMRAALLRKAQASGELRERELAAFAEAVVHQERTLWALGLAARLTLARLDLSRSRTRERGLFKLEAVNEAGVSEFPPGAARLRCSFMGFVPAQTTIKRELAEAYVAVGAVSAAVGLYERLQLWDGAIVCWRLLGKPQRAEALVRERLRHDENDARLWCALGDLALDPNHYERAWEVSGQRSSRAQRSLARYFQAQMPRDYARAITHWRTALSLSPLHPEAWFSLGYCCLQTQDYAGARTAYTQCVQQQPDNGEAWNNLAAAHIRARAWRPAFAALTQALKHKRDSWQAWENYAGVAVKIHEWSAVALALSQEIKLSEGQRIDLDSLKALVDRIERGHDEDEDGESSLQEEEEGEELVVSSLDEQQLASELAALVLKEDEHDDKTAADGTEEKSTSIACPLSTTTNGTQNDSSIQAAADARGAALLRSACLRVLKAAAASGAGGADLWALYARFHESTDAPDAPTAALECRLKETRALQGVSWQADQPRFERFARSSCDLANAYIAAAAAQATETKRHLAAARMQLRGVIRAARDKFEDAEEFANLETKLQEVESVLAKLQ